jgi:hypothetical protein
MKEISLKKYKSVLKVNNSCPLTLIFNILLVFVLFNQKCNVGS